MPLLHYCAQLGIVSSNLVKMLAHQMDEEYLGQLAIEFGKIILPLVMVSQGHRVFFQQLQMGTGSQPYFSRRVSAVPTYLGSLTLQATIKTRLAHGSRLMLMSARRGK